MSWLKDYLDYTQYQESPELFHMWTGIMTIAAVLNRRVWVDRGDMGVTWYKVYPGQLMAVLVAPSGKGHKGTAMRLGRELMVGAGVRVLKGKGSTEKLIDDLAGVGRTSVSATGRITTGQPDAVATIIAPELSVFLSRQVYADSLIDFLTDIADADGNFTYSIKTGGDRVLHNPCLTVYAGATPRSIGESIPEKAHSSGYLSRVLHIFHSGIERPHNSLVNRHKPGSKIKRADGQVVLVTDEITRLAALKQSLIDRLEKMKTLNGPYVFTDDGAEWFDTWYQKWATTPHAQTEGYPVRRPDHMLRIAPILRASEDLVQELDPPVLSMADAVLTQIEPGFVHAFAGIGRNASAQQQERVLDVFRSFGGRAHSKQLYNMIARYFRDITEIKQVFQTLVESGEIIYEGIDPSTKQEWWRIA